MGGLTDGLDNLPPRDPAFQGREVELAELHEKLGRTERGCITSTVDGPAGKTALAVEFAWRHRDEYDVVWWVDAESPERIDAALHALAGALGVEQAADADAQLRILRGWFARNPRWLLVFDGATRPDELKRYFPPGRGHCLLTSRHRLWGTREHRVLLKP